jgi:DNA modification methylase
MTAKRPSKSAPPADSPSTPSIRDRIKEFKRVPVSQLRDNPRNWRTHPLSQREALRAVWKEIGIANAVIAYEAADGVLELIDGHLRKEEVAGDEDIPVLVLDVTEAEADKLLVTLDPLGAMAEADRPALVALLKSVETGEAALSSMLADLALSNKVSIEVSGNAGQADPDEVPLQPDAAITQPGDLWILGNHRLLCGDSSKSEDVDRLLGGQPIHIVNTDPPYNVKVEPRSNNAIAAGLSSFQRTTHHQQVKVERPPQKSQRTTKKLRPKDRPLANDFVTDDEFDRLLAAWFGNLARVLLPGRAFYIWGGYANVANYPPVLKNVGLYFSQSIIWDKQHPVLTRKDFMGAHEWCFYGWKEGAAHQFYGPNNATDLWSLKKVNPQSMVHLTEKPVELAARAMEYSSKVGENVLDLFGGSGSTLIAAEQTGRRAFLMELDALYCDVIVQRWEKFTGKKAKLKSRSK